MEAVEHAVLKRLTVLPLFTALAAAAAAEDRLTQQTHLEAGQAVVPGRKTCMELPGVRALSAARAAAVLAANIFLRLGLEETAETAVVGALAVLVGPVDERHLILREEPVAVAQPYPATETSHGWPQVHGLDQFRKEET